MILPDVNVLLYAFIPDSPQHRDYREWLSAVINRDEEFGMSTQVLCSVIRIATHPKIYAKPQETRVVNAFVSALLRQPNCKAILPGARHWSIFVEQCRLPGINGNLVQDAWLAALAIEHACEWITTDRDFAKFPDLRWRSAL